MEAATIEWKNIINFKRHAARLIKICFGTILQDFYKKLPNIKHIRISKLCCSHEMNGQHDMLDMCPEFHWEGNAAKNVL